MLLKARRHSCSERWMDYQVPSRELRCFSLRLGLSMDEEMIALGDVREQTTV